MPLGLNARAVFNALTRGFAPHRVNSPAADAGALPELWPQDLAQS